MQEGKETMGKYKYRCNRCGWEVEKVRNIKDKATPIFCHSVDDEGRGNCDGVAFLVGEDDK
jgi:predicted nucleic acid-binding Zn ribbon protein